MTPWLCLPRKILHRSFPGQHLCPHLREQALPGPCNQANWSFQVLNYQTKSSIVLETKSPGNQMEHPTAWFFAVLWQLTQAFLSPFMAGKSSTSGVPTRTSLTWVWKSGTPNVIFPFFLCHCGVFLFFDKTIQKNYHVHVISYKLYPIEPQWYAYNKDGEWWLKHIKVTNISCIMITQMIMNLLNRWNIPCDGFTSSIMIV